MSTDFFNVAEGTAEYIFIRGGEYKFSATDKKVTAPDLYFAKFPVTNKRYRIFLESLSKEKREEYESYVKDEKCFNGDDQPVVGITWYAAMAYCEWVTTEAFRQNVETFRNVSMVFRLPTEIEWEWAAGGRKRKFPWGNEEPDETRANYGNKVGHTTSVGAYPAGATPEGLMDMAGNVWEWCLNSYDEPGFVVDKNLDLVKNWRTVKSDDTRALRGGTYGSKADDLRAAYRYDVNPCSWFFDRGFRVVVSAEL